MQIISILVTEEPHNCLDCPMFRSKDCGEIVHTIGNGSTQYKKIKADNCLIKVTDKKKESPKDILSAAGNEVIARKKQYIKIADRV